jgi:hypothetical protein
MKKAVLAVLSAIAIVTCLGASGFAQTGGSQAIPARASIPRTSDGRPNFTGVWAGPGFTHQVGPGDTDTPAVRNFDSKLFPAFVPGAEALFNQKPTGSVLHDDPTALCLPDGHPREILAPYATEFLQFPGVLIIHYEYMHFFRTIYTDGRPHPKDVDLTYEGDSAGHWEGDTLVIDTIGLREYPLDAATNPYVRYHSDALHVIERIQYTDPMTASYVITIDDPKIFTKPWSQEFAMKLHPTWKLYEQVCEENNRCEAGRCSAPEAQKDSR